LGQDAAPPLEGRVKSMNKQEIQRLFALLSSFFPNARQARDGNIRLAWGMALEDTSYDQAKRRCWPTPGTTNIFLIWPICS